MNDDHKPQSDPERGQPAWASSERPRPKDADAEPWWTSTKGAAAPVPPAERPAPAGRTAPPERPTPPAASWTGAAPPAPTPEPNPPTTTAKAARPWHGTAPTARPAPEVPATRRAAPPATAGQPAWEKPGSGGTPPPAADAVVAAPEAPGEVMGPPDGGTPRATAAVPHNDEIRPDPISPFVLPSPTDTATPPVAEVPRERVPPSWTAGPATAQATPITEVPRERAQTSWTAATATPRRPVVAPIVSRDPSPPRGPRAPADEPRPTRVPDQLPLRRVVNPTTAPRPFELAPTADRSTVRLPTPIFGSFVLAELFLIWSFLMPSTPEGTFQSGVVEIADVGGGSFLAALLAVALLIVALVRTSLRTKGFVFAVVSLNVLAFGFQHFREDLLRLVFRGHPALADAFLDRPVVALTVFLGLLWSAGLRSRQTCPASPVPRILTALGIVALVTLYLIFPFVNPNAATATAAVTNLIATVSSMAAMQGDRIAAAFTLAPLAAVPLGLLVFLPSRRRPLTTLFGSLLPACLVTGLTVLALHVAKPTDWLSALPALKAVFLLNAGIVLWPAAAAYATHAFVADESASSAP